MAVIYCSDCELGVHYVDVCWGGKNGKPQLTVRQHRIETLKVWGIGIAITIIINAIIWFAVTEGFTNWN